MTTFTSRICERRLADHAHLQRIAGGRPDLRALHRLLSNARAFSAALPRWYVALLARVHDACIQSLLARQLADELGNGDPSRRHVLMYDLLLRGLEEVTGGAPLSAGELEPGRRFERLAGRCYGAERVEVGLGAVVAGEMRALEFNLWLGELMGRQDELDLTRFEWYREHATLEVQHAADGEEIVRRLGADGRSAALAGARAFDAALLGLLDDLSRAECGHAGR